MVFLKCLRGFVIILFDFEFALVQRHECIRHLCPIWVVTLCVKVAHDSSLAQSLLLQEGMAESITKLSRVTDDKRPIECEQDFYKPLRIGVNEAPLSIGNDLHKQYQSREGLSMLKSLKIISEEPGFLELMADWKGQVKWLLQTRLLTFLN